MEEKSNSPDHLSKEEILEARAISTGIILAARYFDQLEALRSSTRDKDFSREKEYWQLNLAHLTKRLDNYR